MTARWWAPSGAHIGPDEVDMERLQSGGDPVMDLGQALLTVHRVGAAACEAVAAAPMCSEKDLVDALSLARLAFADPVVDSISKAVGQETYAALLVRDVVDDAERAALDLYRAAVAKGVAPPLAAQRVGAVYGVGAEALAQYRTLACTPAVNPTAIADAADRALFGFVSKLVEDEAPEPAYELVSKAPAGATLDNPQTDYYDARTADGRFASTRTATKAKTSILERLRSMKAPQEAKPAVQRVQRVKRVQRTTRPEHKPETKTAVPEGKLKLRRELKRNLQTLTQQQALNLQKIATENKPDRGDVKFKGDMMRRFPESLSIPWEDLNHDLVFHLTESEKLRLENQATGNAYEHDPHRFRVGALLEGLREGDADVALRGDREAESYSYNRAVGKGVTPTSENAVRLVMKLPQNATESEINGAIEQDAIQWAETYFGDVPGVRDEAMRDEMQRYFPITVRSGPAAGQRYLVHAPSLDFEGSPLDVPIINEYQIAGHEVEGALTPTAARGRVGAASVEPILNEDNALEILNEPRLEYDPVQGVLVRIFQVQRHYPTDNVEKAAAVLQDDPRTVFYDARDTSGRFAARPSLLAQVTPQSQGVAKPKKVQRVQRVKRVQRQEAEPQQQDQTFDLKTQVMRNARMKLRQADTRRKLQLKQAGVTSSDEEMRTIQLNKTGNYVVVPRSMFNKLLTASLEDNDRFTNDNEISEWVTVNHAPAMKEWNRLYNYTQQWHGKRDEKVNDEEAAQMIHDLTVEELYDKSGADYREYGRFFVKAGDPNAVWNEISEEVEQIYAEHPDLVELQLEWDESIADHASIRLMGNAQPIDAPVVIEMDEALNGKPVKLIYKGKGRFENLPEQGKYKESIMKPEVQLFKLTGGQAHQFSAEPDYGD